MFCGSMADNCMAQLQWTCPSVLTRQGGQESISDKGNVLADIVDMQGLLKEQEGCVC